MKDPMERINEILDLGVPEVRLLRPRAGDTIVVRLPDRLSDMQFMELTERIGSRFPSDMKVVVLENGASLEVIRDGNQDSD